MKALRWRVPSMFRLLIPDHLQRAGQFVSAVWRAYAGGLPEPDNKYFIDALLQQHRLEPLTRQ